MRELDSIAIVGAGRLGTALTAALGAAGLAVRGPLGRATTSGGPAATGGLATANGGATMTAGATIVLLCVPDSEIAAAAAAIAPGPLVGHCSGATGLAPLAPHEAFSLHPLMTVPAGAPPGVLAGAGCAIDGSTPRARAAAEALAAALGMRATLVAEDDRAAYHAAASIASNFLVTLEGAAERLAATSGVDRALPARSFAPRSRTGPPRARRTRSPGRSPAATRRPSPGSGPPSRSGRPTSSRCSTR